MYDMERKIEEMRLNMKSNFFKYLFAIFVICIMFFAVYKIKTEEEKQEQDQTTVGTEEKKITEITLGVASLDSTNPILSKNLILGFI